MIKWVFLLHRKPGMTRQQFVERYESKHREIGEKYLRPHAARYVRRYSRAMDATIFDDADLPADVVMEVWFEDQAALDSAIAAMSTEAAQAEIIADEEALFDRARMVNFFVDEYESDLNNKEAVSHA